MKVPFPILLALISSFLLASRSDAASVHYLDENGKVHYVNTEYSKVPERYLSQVEDQLKKLNEEKVKSVPVPGEYNPGNQQNVTIQQSPVPVIDTTPAAPVTNENRLTRLTNTLTELQVTGYFPPSVNIHSGVIGYIDRSGQKVFVTPENLASVKPEYLPQVDSQIISLEKIAKQARQERPLIPGTAVEVFTKASCSECVKLLTLLQVHKIPYLNYDVATTSQGAEFYQSMNNAELPITRVKGQIINGVDVGGIKKALNPPAAVTVAPTTPNNNTWFVPPDTSASTNSSNTSGMKIEQPKLPKQTLTVNHFLGKTNEK